MDNQQIYQQTLAQLDGELEEVRSSILPLQERLEDLRLRETKLTEARASLRNLLGKEAQLSKENSDSGVIVRMGFGSKSQPITLKASELQAPLFTPPITPTEYIVAIFQANPGKEISPVIVKEMLEELRRNEASPQTLLKSTAKKLVFAANTTCKQLADKGFLIQRELGIGNRVVYQLRKAE